MERARTQSIDRRLRRSSRKRGAAHGSRRVGKSIRRRSPRCAPCSAMRPGAATCWSSICIGSRTRYGSLAAAHLVALASGDEALARRSLRGGDVLSPLRRREGRRIAAARDHRARLRDAVVRAGRRVRAARRARARLRCRRQGDRRAMHRPLRARARGRRRQESGRRRDGGNQSRCGREAAFRARDPAPCRLRRVPGRWRLSHARFLRAGRAQRRRGASRRSTIGPARTGRRRFSGGPQMADRARRARAAAAWRSTSTKASRGRSRTATTWSGTRIASSKAC